MSPSNKYSVFNILKETYQALHKNDQVFYKLADNHEMIIQDLLVVFEV